MGKELPSEVQWCTSWDTGAKENKWKQNPPEISEGQLLFCWGFFFSPSSVCCCWSFLFVGYILLGFLSFLFTILSSNTLYWPTNSEKLLHVHFDHYLTFWFSFQFLILAAEMPQQRILFCSVKRALFSTTPVSKTTCLTTLRTQAERKGRWCLNDYFKELIFHSYPKWEARLFN